MKNGETRLLEIDAFITELEAILEEALRSQDRVIMTSNNSN